MDTILTPSISASEQLLVTLRFLATGDSYHSLSYLFRIPVCTLSRIIPEYCAALFDVLKDTYLKVPKSEAECKSHAEKFEARWNFPHCLAAIDGKHVNIQAPANSGSSYFNYKGAHSIVLMAMADAEHKFIYVDIECNGRISDGGVFQNCKISKALTENSLNIPQSQFLPGVEIPMPYVIVADNAFPLKSYIMKPYLFQNLAAPNRVFNYRLSRARRIVENVLGLISNRFRVLRKPIKLCPEKVVLVVSAICALHNFLMPLKSPLKNPNVSNYTIDAKK